ncbi:hypothetical protein ACDT16_13855, partial [Staphylococcus aureus]
LKSHEQLIRTLFLFKSFNANANASSKTRVMKTIENIHETKAKAKASAAWKTRATGGLSRLSRRVYRRSASH